MASNGLMDFITATPPPTKEVDKEVLPFVRVYKDGTVERPFTTPYVPPSLQDSTSSGISTKDITISSNTSARIYLPPITSSKKLPILVYYHGGGFVVGSAFVLLEHEIVKAIVSESNVLAVSVEYRLAPEHSLSDIYEDSWEALQWVASQTVQEKVDKDPWLVEFGDFDKFYLGGDSAGGNIVHNMLIKAGEEELNGGVKILGGFLSHPYFYCSEMTKDSLSYKVWMLVNPSRSIDDPVINPWGSSEKHSLAKTGCSRLFVIVSEKDHELRESGYKYCEAVKESGWDGELEVFEFKGEGHCFHFMNLETQNAKRLMKMWAAFMV